MSLLFIITQFLGSFLSQRGCFISRIAERNIIRNIRLRDVYHNAASLIEHFGERLQTDQQLNRFTASRIGGPADALLEVRSVDELVTAASACWLERVPFHILGGGSNVLISDRGARCLIVINRAHAARIITDEERSVLWAESGANLGALARLVASKGFSGLEWAAGIPGTIGGAVVGNAGAHGSDMASNLHLAEILHLKLSGEVVETGRECWTVDDFLFSYRSSVLKNTKKKGVVLSARLTLQQSNSQMVKSKMDELAQQRRKTQPPGASMGSMFKNPPGDYAGRLIDAAGLKGARSGGAQISTLHANFFVNESRATAEDVYRLICRAHNLVLEKFGIDLELEVELLGEWKYDDKFSSKT